MRTERATFDPYGRKRLSDLEDADPIFLTRRRTPYNRDAFYHHWRRLFATRPSQKDGEQNLPPLEFTPHDMRHLRVTLWLTNIRKIKDSPQAQMLRRCVQRRMAWRSPLTLECYDHSFTEREEEEAFAVFQRETEQKAAEIRIAPEQVMEAQIKKQPPEPRQGATLSQAIADLEFWRDEL